jgi:hypothetical protein
MGSAPINASVYGEYGKWMKTRITCSERNQSSQRPIRKCTERHSEVLGIRSADPRFPGGNTGAHGPLYLDEDLLKEYIKHAHGRTEQEVYIWMTTSDMGSHLPKRERKSSAGETLSKIGL